MARTKSNHERLLATVEATYRLAERSFDALHSAAKGPEEKECVRELYGAARDAYWKAVLACLEDRSGVVAALHDATGVWFDSLPLTPDRVVAALRRD